MVLTMIISSKTFSAEDGVNNEDIISGIMIFKSNQFISLHLDQSRNVEYFFRLNQT